MPFLQSVANKLLLNRLRKVSGFLLILVCLTQWLFSPEMVSSAQNTTGSWTTPVNLSRSGSTNNPTLLVDPNGLLRVIWQDKSAGFFHTYQTSNGWAAPAILPAPWIPENNSGQGGKSALESPVPLIIADRSGLIYAFWIDYKQELWATRTAILNFGSKGSWENPVKLADLALNMTATVDSNNQIHLVYISQNQIEGKQAGIYYLRMPPGGTGWLSEYMLMGDAYFRSIKKDQANLNIAVGSSGGTDTLFVAWDNRPLKRVFLARSTDGGKTWEQPKEIAGPDSSTGGAISFNITVGAAGSNAIVLWQVGQSDTCQQFSKTSTDSGATWSNRQPMLTEMGGCAQQTQFIISRQNRIFLTFTIYNRVYLLGWNGVNWSEPQPQQMLYGFINPETYNTINLQCHQYAFVNDNKLVSIGCDVSDLGDIWFTSREIGSIDNWYQQASAWNPPSIIKKINQPVTGVTLVPDGESIVHAFWIQSDSVATQGVLSIYYTRWNGTNWSNPTVIQRQPDGGNITELSAALSNQGRLLLTWGGGPGGEIYFSWADASNAVSESEWAKPLRLPALQQIGSSPRIIVAPSGAIYVTYAIPINEDRGIYLVNSINEGQTWSDPVKVFDAVAARWSYVDTPRLYCDSTGRLGIVWFQRELQDRQAEGLYSSISDDQGLTWHPAQKISDTRAEWSQVVSTDKTSVSIAWLDVYNQQSSLRVARSIDGGLNWDRSEIVINAENAIGPAALLSDASGKLHLFLINQGRDMTLWLERYALEEGKWLEQDPLQLASALTNHATNLSVAITGSGHVYASYSIQTVDVIGQTNTNVLEFSDFQLKKALTQQTLAPVETPVNALSLSSTAIPTTTDVPLSPTALSPAFNIDKTPGRQTNLWGGLMIGVLLSGLIIIIGVSINKFHHGK